MKSINIDIQKIIIGAVLTILLSTTGFVVNGVVRDIKDVEDSKVDNEVLIQYMKLIEERNNLQLKVNDTNADEHKEILQELKELNEKIHNLDVKLIGFIRTRGTIERWDLQAVTLFMLEARVYDTPKNVGLI